MLKEENLEIRILSFFGIIMVVATHCDWGGVSLFYDLFNPTTFELGIFAFISGYFFINNIHKSNLSIIKNKLKKLIVPLYFWTFVYAFFGLCLNKIGFQFPFAPLNFKTLLLSPIYSGHEFLFNLGSWFLVPLFMIQIFSLIFKPLLKKNYGPYIIFVIYLLLGMAGIAMAIKGFNQGWNLVITRFLYFLPFFGLGLLYKTKLEKKERFSNFVYLFVILFLQLITVYIGKGRGGYIPSWSKGFTNCYMPYIYGFLGVLFWLRISKILLPSLKDSKIVKLISRNTFAIMMHHYLGFFSLNIFYGILTMIFPFITGFNFTRFRTEIGYRYLPNDLSNFKLIYLFAGLLVPLVLVKIKDIILKKLNERNKS